MSEHITTSVEAGVLTITIDRPEKKNALTLAMYEAITAALADAASRDDVRVALLAGAGGTFTAGNDLADFVANPPAGEDSPVFRFLQAVSTFEKPLLAAVAGPAVGIGTTVLLHCDVVYAASGARLALPFVNLGLCPEAAASYLLPLAVGLPRASAWLLFGEPFSAEEAHAAGLVHEVLDEPALLAHATERARALAQRPPASVRLTKRLLRAGHAEATRLAMREEAQHFLDRLGSEEAAEAFTAFFEKRAPDFSRFA
jgi:enoyl-CoA hydratase/carnithine racemase